MRYRWTAGCFLSVAVFVWRAWPSLWSTVDDAWISARYAAQAASGNGLVYNAGEPPIEGYTNLLWTVWLAVGVATGLPLDAWMVGTGLVCGAATVVFAGLVARQLSEESSWWIPGLASGLVALDVHHAIVSTNGLETSLFNAAALFATWAVFGATGRWRWGAGIAIGLLGAIRPEGFVVGAALVVASALTSTRPSLLRDTSKVAVPYFAIAGLLTLRRLWTYGDWVPNTVHAKARGHWWTYLDSNFAYLGADGPFWIAALVSTAVALFLGWRDVRRWVLVGAALAMTTIAFRVDLWMPGARLLVSPLTLCLIVIASVAGTRSGLALGALTLFGMLVAPFTEVERHNRRYDHIHSVELPNPASRAAAHIGAQLPPGSWLAVRDAGVVAHFVGAHVKVAELHNRALTQLHVDGADARPLEYTPRNPEVIVLTAARKDKGGIRYAGDRRVFQSTTVPYRYLGRVYQHYHRFYDFYVRSDLGVTDFPEEWVVSRAGPPAPGSKRQRAPRRTPEKIP